MIICPLCKEKFKRITNSHLSKIHNINASNFNKKFIGFNRGYLPWNKGKTKETDSTLARLSQKLQAQNHWNFSGWQKNKPKSNFLVEKSADWAELVGAVLGDGNIGKFPRTERLRISCNSRDINYIHHLSTIVEKVLKKRPQVRKRPNQNCTDISIYQGNLSRNLQVAVGKKTKFNTRIPEEIRKNKSFLTRCLKGLFETDGWFCVDKKNYTQVIEFKNESQSLLRDAYFSLKGLSYNPQLGKNYVRLAKKAEVYNFVDLINFRRY